MGKTYFTFCIAALFLMLQSCDNKPVELTIMTYNIRMDHPRDSLNNWAYRKDVAAQIIKNYNVDIVGTQEVLKNQMADLKERLPEYEAIGVGRTDGKSEGEYCALFYKKDKFKEIKSGTFWLSETPEVAGSKGWDAACERVATWAFLEDIVTGKRVFAINTHLDHVGKDARINGVTLMMEKAHKIAGNLPVILTGDFNADPESDVIKYVTDEKTLNSLKTTRDHALENRGKSSTFHDFGRKPEETRSCIDYIFVSKDTEVLAYEVIDDKLDGVYLSDHNPVVSKIRIN